MAYLHSRSVVHRDLKSPNLLLDAADRIKVADLGLARHLSATEETMTAETGTYRWMAPELVMHARYDHRADVYSFAIVLWELCTGEVPFGELSSIQAAALVAEGGRPTLRPDMPAALAEMMVACWAAEPAQRPEFAALARRLTLLRCAEEASSSSGSEAAALEGSVRPRSKGSKGGKGSCQASSTRRGGSAGSGSAASASLSGHAAALGDALASAQRTLSGSSAAAALQRLHLAGSSSLKRFLQPGAPDGRLLEELVPPEPRQQRARRRSWFAIGFCASQGTR
jgi:serine/threonine protein kinase